MRAAQYVRMSTEHQQYSIDNQIAAIGEYASSHDFEVVHTYSDEARSGIDLARRPGLRQLLDDIVTCRADFRAVLVYDISRWGRFQDTDESACYEFLCKQAGVNVVYCAEPFANDISVAASLLKTLKRTMAGEYLRELSAKVHAGQCRLARKGYKLGGSAGFGLRRVLLGVDGKPKLVLKRGERKCLATERVTYVQGPARELRIVRKIYSLFLDSDLNCSAIARWLNERNVPREVEGRWKREIVQRILSHPKYIGCVVFNRKSARLRSKPKLNPTVQWVVSPNSFPAVISQKKFEQAQEKLRRRVFLRSDEELLQELRDFVRKHGKATQIMLSTDKNMATLTTYTSRFGSFQRALELIRTEPSQGFSTIERRTRLKIWLQDEFARTMAAANILSRRWQGVFLSSCHPPVLLDVARCFTLNDGQLRWEIRYPLAGVGGLRCITLRLDPNNKLPLDYVFFPQLPPTVQRCRFSEERIQQMGFVRSSLAQAIELFLMCKSDLAPERQETKCEQPSI
jgi:DNA invertase Pin-like site-specific DNA recombinase